MHKYKCDFRRLGLISMVLISISAAKELEGVHFILFFSIIALILKHMEQIRCH